MVVSDKMVAQELVVELTIEIKIVHSVMFVFFIKRNTHTIG